VFTGSCRTSPPSVAALVTSPREHPSFVRWRAEQFDVGYTQ
jgi:hypothetical protein